MRRKQYRHCAGAFRCAGETRVLTMSVCVVVSQGKGEKTDKKAPSAKTREKLNNATVSSVVLRV